MFKKKESKVKVEFTITVHQLKGVPTSSNGHEFIVECKRGAKTKNHASTQKQVANGTSINFEEKLKFYCTFFEDPKTKKFDQKKKELSLTIKEEAKTDKKSTVFGKGVINLTTFAEHGTIRNEIIAIKTEKKVSPSPSLMVKVEAVWQKLDNKKLVKKTEATKDDAKNGEIKVGGEEFVLQPTEDVTETNASHSDDEEQHEEFPDDDNESKASESSESKKIDSKRSSLKSMESDVPNPTKKHEEEIKSLKERYEAEIHDLVKDRERLEKKVSKLSAQENTESVDNEELEDLKRDNARLEKKVEKLSKELDDKKKELEAQKSASASVVAPVKDTSSADKDQLKKVQDEKSKLEAKVAELQKQIDAEVKAKGEFKQSLDKLKEDTKKKAKTEEDMEALKKQLEESKASLEQTKKSLDDTKKSWDDTKKTLEDTKKSLDEAKKSQKDLSDQVAKQKEQISQLEKSQKASPATTSKPGEDKKKLEDTIAQLKTELENEKKAKVAAEQSRDELKDKAQELEKEVQKFKEKKNKLYKELEELEASHESSTASLNAKIADLEAELAKRPTAQEQKGSKESARGSSAQVDTLTKQLNDQKKEFTEKLQASEKRVAELQSKLQTDSPKDKTVKDSDQTKQLDEIKKDLEATKKKLQEESKAKESLEKELSALKKKQSDEPSKKESSEDDEEQLKSKISLMRKDKELEALKKKVTSLQQEVDEKRLIESAIYAAEPEYDEEKGVASNVPVIVGNIVAWHAFNPPNEELLSNIIGSIKKSFTRSAYDSEILAFWLSLTSSLYVALKKELPRSVDLDEDMLVTKFAENAEASDLEPIPKFFFELLSLVFDIYSVLLINLYSQLDNILLPAILESNKKKSGTDYCTILVDIVKLLKKNYILDSLQKHFLNQIFYFMDAQVFNAMLKRPELYSAGNGFQISMGVSQVEAALGKVDKQQGLQHIREAANLLVMDKTIVGDEAATAEIFSHMNVVQIKHFVDKFKPDDLSPDPVSATVKKSLEESCARRRDLPLEIEAMAIKKVDLMGSSA